MEGEVHSSPLLRFGVFELDLRTGELRKSGKLIRLAPQPFRLLALLAGKPGELVTREEIQRELWGGETVVDYEQGLSFVIKKARSALGDSSHSPRYIETLPRRGYRFIAPVCAGNHSESVPSAGEPARRSSATQASPWWRSGWLLGAALAAIAAVLFAFNVGGLRDRVLPKPPPRIRSIAVLPLENFSKNPKQAYFADGMTDELITDLSKVSSLRVIASASTVAYKGSRKPLQEIARELNVDAVVEGSVEEADGRVRINVQLADASTDRNLWAQSYERDAKDVLSLQNDVAESIAKQIRAQVTPEEKRRLAAARTVNPAAHDAYLRGRYVIDQRSKNAALSTEYFRKAIKLDPSYAAAYAGLSISLVSQTFLDTALPKVAFPKARAAARHALQLNPDLGEAYTALGTIEFSYDWNWKTAKQNLQRGIQLNPSDPLAEILYTFDLASMGDLKGAIAGARKAVELDPVSFFANRNLAMMFYYDRQYDAALAQLQRTRELHNNPGGIDDWARWIYISQHKYDKAIHADLEEIAAAGVPAADLNFFRAAYARGGWRSYWKARIQRELPLAKIQSIPFFLAIMYVRIGDRDKAIHWLKRAVDQHSIWVMTLAVDPKLDPLRSDPRFQALLRCMNLAS